MTNESYVNGLRFKVMDLQLEALQTALANTVPRTSENANSTFLFTEALINLQFRCVLKSRYIAGQWYNLWKGGLLILDVLLPSRIYPFCP